MKLGPFPLGMNNKTESHDLPPGSVRNAVNVDFTDSGRIRRRDGITKIYSGINVRDSFDCPIGTFFVEGSDLKSLNDDNSATILKGGIHGDTVAYEYRNEICYFSDGLITLKIYPDGSVTQWGIDIPVAPLIHETAGSCDAGDYIAAVTFVDINGKESGISGYAVTAIVSGKGIKFINLPFSTDPQVVGLSLYLSMPNGSSLFHVGQVANGTAAYTVSSPGYDTGRILENGNIVKPPACSIIKYYHGRMYNVVKNVVWYTEEFAPDWCDSSKNYLQFPHDIVMMQPVTDGIYFADTKSTVFYAGAGPADFIVQDVFDYGAVYGLSKKIKNSNNVVWVSQRGVVIGGPSGQIRNLDENNLAIGTADSASLLIREENGLRQVLASLKNPTTSTLVCSSFATVEVIRKAS